MLTRTCFFIILLLFAAVPGFPHDGGNGPFPQFYIDNIDNLPLLAKYIGLNVQNPICGLHYYYYRNSTAQQIIANLMDYADISVQLECLGVIGHCAKAPLSKSVREQMVHSLKRMCGEENIQLRAKAAYCIGANNFFEMTDTIIEMINDSSPAVRKEVFNALGCLRAISAKAKAEARFRIEKNKAVRYMIQEYLNLIKK